MEPNQFAGRGAGLGGITSAMGLPRRVMRMGVFYTRSSNAKHLALNSEMAISSTVVPHFGQLDVP
jgi:hypothetical protein